MNLKKLFQEELILFETSEDIEELFEKVGKYLSDKNLVTDDYIQAVKQREEEFPTGLLTQYLEIALPHTDSKHIYQPFVAVVRTEQPIHVKQMGDNQSMYTRDFLFLGIKEAEGYSQVELLSKLMELFSDEKFVSDYKESATQAQIYKVFNMYL